MKTLLEGEKQRAGPGDAQYSSVILRTDGWTGCLSQLPRLARNWPEQRGSPAQARRRVGTDDNDNPHLSLLHSIYLPIFHSGFIFCIK